MENLPAPTTPARLETDTRERSRQRQRDRKAANPEAVRAAARLSLAKRNAATRAKAKHNRRPWCPAEDTLLRLNPMGRSRRELAKMLRRTLRAVDSRITALRRQAAA